MESNCDKYKLEWRKLCFIKMYRVSEFYLYILWAGVQPTLDPYAEAFYSRPIALTLGGEEFSVNDVCKCMRDCRVEWAE